MLGAILSRRAWMSATEKLRLLRLKSAAKTLENGIEKALVYMRFPVSID